MCAKEIIILTSWLIIGIEGLSLNACDKKIQMLEYKLHEHEKAEIHAPTVILMPVKEDKNSLDMQEEMILESDVEMLAHLINGEAGADWCSDNMQLAVGSVVLNRINHAEFPNTMQEVIYQDGQYACTWNGAYNREPDERAYDNSRYLLEHGSILPKDVVWQANFEQGKEVYAKIQNMYFCR